MLEFNTENGKSRVIDQNAFEVLEKNLKNNQVLILGEPGFRAAIERKLYMDGNNDQYTLISGDLWGTGKITTLVTAYKTQELRDYLGIDDNKKWDNLICICQRGIGQFTVDADGVYIIPSLGRTQSIRLMLLSIAKVMDKFDSLFNEEHPFKWEYVLMPYVSSDEYQECWFPKKKKTPRRRTHIPKGLRHEVFKRDNYTCVECGARKEDGAVLHVDHIIPVSQGGTDELSNLQTLCDKCNMNKSNLIQ